jgi:hypothetical protein
MNSERIQKSFTQSGTEGKARVSKVWPAQRWPIGRSLSTLLRSKAIPLLRR